MLELRFSAGYSYGDSFRKKNKRGPPSVEVMFRLVLECVFLPFFFLRKRDSWPFDLLFLFNVFDIHDEKHALSVLSFLDKTNHGNIRD